MYGDWRDSTDCRALTFHTGDLDLIASTPYVPSNPKVIPDHTEPVSPEHKWVWLKKTKINKNRMYIGIC